MQQSFFLSRLAHVWFATAFEVMNLRLMPVVALSCLARYEPRD